RVAEAAIAAIPDLADAIAALAAAEAALADSEAVKAAAEEALADAQTAASFARIERNAAEEATIIQGEIFVAENTLGVEDTDWRLVENADGRVTGLEVQ